MKLTATTDEERALCPIRSVLARATGKWQFLILLTLADGPLRFGALKRALGDISQRVLTENLRAMERDGYLTRSVDTGRSLAVTYALTPLGRELAGLLKPLARWAAARFEQVEQARREYDARI